MLDRSPRSGSVSQFDFFEDKLVDWREILLDIGTKEIRYMRGLDGGIAMRQATPCRQLQINSACRSLPPSVYTRS